MGFPVMNHAVAEGIAREILLTPNYVEEHIKLIQRANPLLIHELCAYGVSMTKRLSFDSLLQKRYTTYIVTGGIIVYRMLEAQHEVDEMEKEPDCIINPAYRAALETANAVEREKAGDAKRFESEVIVEHSDGSTFHFKHAYAITWGRWLIVIPEHGRVWCAIRDDLASFEQVGKPIEVRL